MRLTTRTNLAMRTLMFCAVNPDRIVRKHEIAEACNASENHLAQVVNTLAQRGFIETQRGRSGGLRLARPMDQIGVGEVLRAFEATLPFAECFDLETNTCPLHEACMFREALLEALEAFYATMDRRTLADLIEDNAALEHLLRLPTAQPISICGTNRRSGASATAAQAALN
ncbi:RrF2 family transcriptional regulator [Sedimentimonas flavescens]|uniref:RrF2 family transcriptional regulator n=1 Tax=Sedimentimonas flavescens TaxID=2851012 RepID=UPI001C4A2749|nr:Rrf2 family transcriptional regulator [Sedimentimonas flavescens]MBW0157241.1 Rrf2 family transcriptional regulator [Sedimentimonas flavescens]